MLKLTSSWHASKREHESVEKTGQADEMEADAISSTPFKLLMTWVTEEGNIFVWCFSMLMWYLMACSVNVKCLSLHNLKRGIHDSIVFKYGETKMNLCRRRMDIPTPAFAALGCYLSIHSEQEQLEGTGRFFVYPGLQICSTVFFITKRRDCKEVL
jgi:hypothetical protein